MTTSNEKEGTVMSVVQQRVYYVVTAETVYTSFDEARTNAPTLIAAHIARSKELQVGCTLLMSGAFLDTSQEPLRTMAILTSQKEAEEYITGDPLVLNGLVHTWSIREWANMFA